MRESSSACDAVVVEPLRHIAASSVPKNSIGFSSPAGVKPSAARAEPRRSGVAVDAAPDCKASPSPEAIPKSDTCFVSWVSSFLGLVWSSRTGLGSFLRLSSRAPACTALPDERSGDVWPVPLPVACWTADAKCKLSPRRRRKARLHKLAGELLRLQVGTLNWLALGCPSVPPARACTRGAALSSDQLNALDILERHCRHFLRAGPFNLSSLGRSGEKFDNLLSRALELPQADSSCACDVDRLLAEFVSALHSDWCPYGPRPRTPTDSAPPPSPQDAASCRRCRLPLGVFGVFFSGFGVVV